MPSYPRHRARRVPPASIELIRQARRELGYGAARTRLWLQRVHGIRLAMGTIQRVFRVHQHVGRAQVYPDALAEHFGADHPAGLMFGLRWKKFSESYFFFSAANRS